MKGLLKIMQILAERQGCYHLGGMPLFQTVTKIVLILFFFFKRATFGFFKMEKSKLVEYFCCC